MKLVATVLVLAAVAVMAISASAGEQSLVQQEIDYLSYRNRQRSQEWQAANSVYQTHCTASGTGVLHQMTRLSALNDIAREQIRLLDPNAILISPDGYLGEWNVSRYYTPVPDQPYYYGASYEQDYSINCLNDCFKTAWGVDLRNVSPFSVVACPPEFSLGTKFIIEGIGQVTCVDRGGAIKGRRLDLHAGLGIEGLNRILNTTAGRLKVWLYQP